MQTMASAFSKDDNTVKLLRQMALEGKSVRELIEVVFQAFDLRPNEEGLYPFFVPMNCFKDAFSLTIPEAMEIGSWHKFDKPGYTDEELEARIMPLIQQNASKWTKMKSARWY